MWSEDYQGPFSRIYRKLSIFCKTYGKLPRILRSDPAKVELSNEVKEQCASINDVNLPGIEIRAAAPEQQNQNPVERHIQAIDNQMNATIIDQDLLSAAWWGYAA